MSQAVMDFRIVRGDNSVTVTRVTDGSTWEGVTVGNVQPRIKFRMITVLVSVINDYIEKNTENPAKEDFVNEYDFELGYGYGDNNDGTVSDTAIEVRWMKTTQLNFP